MLKRLIRAWLTHFGLYHQVKDTSLYSIYLWLFYREYALARKTEYAFYHAALASHGRLIIDIGANTGPKAAIFARLARRVICVEPVPENIDALRQRFAGNPQVVVVAQGVADMATVSTMSVFGGNHSGYSTFASKWAEVVQAPARSVTVPMTTLDALIAEYGAPSYIKIDVEGYEVQVLRGLSCPVPLLSFECNLPEFASETLECIKRLQGLDASAVFNFTTTEPPARFDMPTWVNGDAIAAHVCSGKLRFMEIWCRMSGATS